MNCSDLSLIPQYSTSCWFNIILTSSLYSQYTRNSIIKASKKWNKKDSFLNILKTILKNYKRPEKVQDFFKKIKPEMILMKMFYKYNFNIKIIKDFKYILRYNKGGFMTDIIYFLNSINDKKVLQITYHKKYYYLNLFKMVDIGRNLCNLNVNSQSFFNETKKIIDDVPDILVVNHYKYYNDINAIFDKLYYSKFCPISFLNRLVLNTYLYNFNILGLDIGNDIIYLNGHKYILDSVLLGNYNIEINKAHAIAGITCNNERYIYNSSNKIKGTGPCSLMKHNWNINNDDNFCLNKKLCKLDFDIDEQELCFNFSKGNRILIYSRINETNEDINSNTNSSSKLSGMNEIVSDIYDIVNMSREHLIDNLIILNKIILKNNNYNINFDNYNNNQLKKMYANDLKKHYNLSKSIDLTEDLNKIKKNNIFGLLKNITKDNLINIIKNFFNYKKKLLILKQKII